jgi:sec-independent protein translocase protein TatA
MFGIGGSEILFIIFMILMLFGSKNIPTIARNFGKIMAQVKNATNEIKSEIQKSAEDSGLDKSIKELTTGFNTEIDSVKETLNSQIENPITQVKEDIEDLSGPIKRQL